MHEMIFVKKILEEAKKAGASNFVRVEVGELAHLSAEELRMALEGASKMDFDIVFRESKVKCSCGYEGRARIIEKNHGYCIFNCPSCNRIPKILEGGEIKILGVE